jgi:D-methionine transport system ATP-binding protein
VITVENLSKTFATNNSRIHALTDVSIDISAGSLYGVVGPAGSGKSTLARCVALRERPDRGVIRWDGVNTAKLDGRHLRDVRRQVGVVSAHSDFSPERTVAGNVAAPLEQLGVDGSRRRSKVGGLLDLVGLTQKASHHLDQLTPGQLKRLALARTLTTEPSVLFVDDPTAGVPIEEHGAIAHVLDRARGEYGATILVTTSDAGVVRRVCDEVAILENGSILERGNILNLLGDSASLATQLLLPSLVNFPAQPGGFDRLVDVVLIGFAAVGALLPEAAQRFDVDFTTVDGGLTRFGDTPVARFRLGARGEKADAALAWIKERGAHLSELARDSYPVAA